MAGWKFNESEMKGYPVRIEIGPKDIEKEQVVLVRRDTSEKEFVALQDLNERLPVLLEEIQKNMFEKAVAHRAEKTNNATTIEEFNTTHEDETGFIKAM